jgi:hypothetical protein
VVFICPDSPFSQGSVPPPEREQVELGGALLLLELTKTLHTCWLVARLDPLSRAELLNLQGKCQPVRAKPAHFVSHLPPPSPTHSHLQQYCDKVRVLFC